MQLAHIPFHRRGEFWLLAIIAICGVTYYMSRQKVTAAPIETPKPLPVFVQPPPAVQPTPAAVVQPETVVQPSAKQVVVQKADLGSVNIAGGISNSTVTINAAPRTIERIVIVREQPIFTETIREVVVPLPANGFNARCEMLRAQHLSKDAAWKHMMNTAARQP